MNNELEYLVSNWLSGEFQEAESNQLLEMIETEQITVEELSAMAMAAIETGDYFSRKRKKKVLVRKKVFAWSAASLCIILSAWFGSSVWISSSKTFTTEAGQTRTVCLKDGSRVVLNSGSSLSVPRNFSESNRSVALNGEATFYVEKSSSPLSVRTPDHGEIIVYGTVFNARSYAEDTQLEIALSEGSVSYKPDASVRPFTIDPGERILFDKTAHVVDIDNADIESSFGWNNGRLVCSDICFCDIVNSLERKYGNRVNLRLSDLSLMARRFSFSIDSDKDFNSAVLHIADIAGVGVSENAGVITIYN